MWPTKKNETVSVMTCMLAFSFSSLQVLVSVCRWVFSTYKRLSWRWVVGYGLTQSSSSSSCLYCLSALCVYVCISFHFTIKKLFVLYYFRMSQPGSEKCAQSYNKLDEIFPILCAAICLEIIIISWPQIRLIIFSPSGQQI